MAGLSTYALDALLDHALGNTAMTAPSTVYVQVHTGDPGADGTGNLSEVTSREVVTFGAAASRVASNDVQVDFDSVTLSGDETWSGVSVWDAASGGNCLWTGTLASGVLMQNGDSFAFAIGDLDISMGGAVTTYLANALIDHSVGTAALTQPAGAFAAMHTGDPGVDGSANAATETTRADCGAFSAAASGSADNDATVTLSGVSTTETYSHVVIHDAATAGNPLFYGALTAAKSMTAGDDAEFAAGELDVALT